MGPYGPTLEAYTNTFKEASRLSLHLATATNRAKCNTARTPPPPEQFHIVPFHQKHHRPPMPMNQLRCPFCVSEPLADKSPKHTFSRESEATSLSWIFRVWNATAVAWRWHCPMDQGGDAKDSPRVAPRVHMFDLRLIWFARVCDLWI